MFILSRVKTIFYISSFSEGFKISFCERFYVYVVHRAPKVTPISPFFLSTRIGYLSASRLRRGFFV